jgi:hypothetical protein
MIEFESADRTLATLRDEMGIVRYQIGVLDAKIKAVEAERDEFRRFVRAVLIANLLVGAVVLLVVVLT